VLNWSISRNHKKIWNTAKISVTPEMYMTREDSVQRSLTSGPRGSAKSLGRSTSFRVGSNQNFLDTCLYEKGKAMAVEKVGGGRTHWPAGHVARLVGHHLASCHLGQVSGTPPWPYKYPLPVKVDTHTPHFGDSTCKALFLSVVVRCSLVRRVVRL
jgi:hypothetical protein